MTNEELENKIKDSFDSIMDNIKDLGEKHKDVPQFQGLLIILLCSVASVYRDTPIHVDERDIIPHKWTYLVYKISQMSAAIPLPPNNTPKEVMRLEDAYEYLKNIDDLLSDFEKISKLLDELGAKENV